MSVIVKSEEGWMIDHKLSSVLTMQKNHDKGLMEQRYWLKSDLFEIVEPFCMDSQHKKMLSLKPVEDGQKRKRKRKRKEPLNSGEKLAEEFHSEVRNCILKAYENLMKLGRGLSYFQEVVSLSGRDNNGAARQAAQWNGTPDLIEMCEIAEQNWNQTWQNRHNTGSQLSFTSNDNQTQEQWNQNSSENHITEVADLSARGLVNVVWQHDGDTAVIVNYKGDNYIIPPHSKFLLSDISYLLMNRKVLGTFDLIVMDPPWTNKSVKRKRKYYTMDSDMMLELPLSDMMKPGCVVVVWVTNKQKHIQFVKEELFPASKIEYMAMWFWLKVTKTGECVYDLDSSHKKPYETLIIGKYHGDTACNGDKIHNTCNGIQTNLNDRDISDKALENKIEYEECGVDDTENSDETVKMSDPCQNGSGYRSRSDGNYGNKGCVPDKRVVMSVPCSLHSKKPPLGEILKSYLPEAPACLELFARNLAAGWTSWGNEVFLHQHTNFYEEIK